MLMSCFNLIPGIGFVNRSAKFSLDDLYLISNWFSKSCCLIKLIFLLKCLLALKLPLESNVDKDDWLASH